MTDATAPSTRAKELRRVPLAQIHPNPDNDRDDLGDLTELATSIADHGIDVEPKVTPHPDVPAGEFMTVYGHRRCAAAALAGLLEITVIVEYGDNAVGGLNDDEIERQRGEENLSRANLKPMEEARVYARRARKRDPRTGRPYTVQQVADFFSKSQGHVSRRLALTQLPKPVQVLVDSGVIGNTDAYVLSQLHEHPIEIIRIVDAFVEGGLGVSISQAVTDTKAELGVVSRSRGRPPRAVVPPPAPPPPAPPVPAEVPEAAIQAAAPAPSPPPPVPPRPKGRPWRSRTQVKVTVALPIRVYEAMVKAQLHGGRYGFAGWASEHLSDYIRGRIPGIPEDDSAPGESPDAEVHSTGMESG